MLQLKEIKWEMITLEGKRNRTFNLTMKEDIEKQISNI